MNILGIIPARLGEKNKNIWSIQGKPLVEWVIDAAKASKLINLLVCSTDSEDVKNVCDRNNVKWLERPEHLRNGDFPIVKLVQNVLSNTANNIDVVALLQPTSPFVTPDQIDESLSMLSKMSVFKSVQTVTTMPHNYHAYNQRLCLGKTTMFVFEKEREKCYNKQTKPEHFIFGNFLATKVDALDNGLFAKPSAFVKIDRYTALDVDTLEDLELANWYVEKGKIN